MFDGRQQVWYTSFPMEESSFSRLVQAADAAVDHAQDTRVAHAKRSARGSRQREDDLSMAQTRLKRLMAPVRSELARMPSELKRMNKGGSAEVGERSIKLQQQTTLRSLSQAIQRERRKLWKMQQRPKKRGSHGKR